MLEIKNLSVRYGRHQALDGVSAKIGKGEVCVILGANGAGKSSLLKAIAGTVRVQPGSEIFMNGQAITSMKAHKIVEQGIALVPEGRGIFGELTVAENLQLGAFASRARAREVETLQLIYSLFPRLAERKSQIARTMSGGEQQMVAIGRALMSQPEILMLDEPSLGLSPVLTKELFRSLAKIAGTGVGILLVEQNARQSLKIAQRGYLIEVGRITGEGAAQSLISDPAVINAYLGGAKRMTTQVRLPQSLLLPGDVGSIARLVGSIARRAGAIQGAFVRAVQQANALPSAFAGRYDPSKSGDPWDNLAASVPRGAPHKRMQVADDGKRLSDLAADLAKAAAQRHSRHIRSLRASMKTPSAFAGVYNSTVTCVEDGMLDSSALARAAASRMADHISRLRFSGPVPSAFVHCAELAVSQVREAEAHGVLGHNSRGIDIDFEQVSSAPQEPLNQAIDITALVTRAAAIQSEHVAARRRALTVINVRPDVLSSRTKLDSR